MTKTLHLYEAHFVALMEEALKGDKLMATAVLEPFTGEKSAWVAYVAWPAVLLWTVVVAPILELNCIVWYHRRLWSVARRQRGAVSWPRFVHRRPQLCPQLWVSG